NSIITELGGFSGGHWADATVASEPIASSPAAITPIVVSFMRTSVASCANRGSRRSRGLAVERLHRAPRLVGRGGLARNPALAVDLVVVPLRHRRIAAETV